MKHFFVLFLVIFSSFSLKAQLSGDKKTEFNKFIREADLLFSQSKFLESKEVYEKALSLDPNDKYALNQRDKSIANSKDNTKVTEDKNYQKIINKADEKFNASDFQNAKSLYQRALGLKPADPYPKKKIDEIDALLNPKPVKKSDPLPDLGISSKISISDAEKILKEAEEKRKELSKNSIDSKDSTQIKNVDELNFNRIKETNSSNKNIEDIKTNIEKNTISTKEQQDSLNIFLQKREGEVNSIDYNLQSLQNDKNNNNTNTLENKSLSLDSLSSVSKTAGADMDVYITLKNMKFSDSLAIAEQKIRDDMFYKIMEINSANHKEEKKHVDNEINQVVLNQMVDSTSNYIEKENNAFTLKKVEETYQVKKNVSAISGKNELVESNEIKRFEKNRDSLQPTQNRYISGSDSLYLIPVEKSYSTIGTLSKIDGKAIDSLFVNDNKVKTEKSNQVLAIEKVLANDSENSSVIRTEAKINTIKNIDSLKTDDSKLFADSKEKQGLSIESLKKIDKTTEDNDASAVQKETEEKYSSMDQLKTIQSKVTTSNSETNIKNGDNSQKIGGISNVLNGNTSIDDNKQTERRQEVRDYLEERDETKTLNDDKSPNDIGATYPEGVTEETFSKNDDKGLPYAFVTRRIVVVSGHGNVYTRTQTRNNITYSKNGKSTTEYVWQLETQDAKLKRN